ncbi:MAG: T9SS type A sorting domain-containing protein [Bacteroidales bacterium]|nr:T9SS type A sorting domain-containing protein [Bacteroidales bacterium]
MAGQIFVSMLSAPVQLTQPAGPTKACNNLNSIYTTEGGSPSDLYVWTLIPAESGTLMSFGTQTEIDWSEDYTGIATLSVHAENSCGEGTESESLEIEIGAATIPQVTGLETACTGWTLPYETTSNPGSSFNWQVTGGTVVSGAGTSQVNILWGTAGTGTVNVTETNAAGCDGLSQTFTVEVDACVGYTEMESKRSLNVFPNPTDGAITIEGLNVLDGSSTLNLLDLSGKILFKKSLASGIESFVLDETSLLSSGVYIIEWMENGVIQGRKMFIKK